ncbi:MAG: FKBP-type peptidyl-prolyl cis-trans isomerase [Gemmatimonadota bacterium]
MTRPVLIALAATLALVAGCNEDATGPNSVPCDPFLLSYGELDRDTTTVEGGVRIIEVDVGSGAAATSASVARVNYSLYSIDGSTLMDSSCSEERDLITVIPGASSGLIPGFRIGVSGMQIGGVRRVIVPSNLAYNTGDLIFDLQLVELF